MPGAQREQQQQETLSLPIPSHHQRGETTRANKPAKTNPKSHSRHHSVTRRHARFCSDLVPVATWFQCSGTGPRRERCTGAPTEGSRNHETKGTPWHTGRWPSEPPSGTPARKQNETVKDTSRQNCQPLACWFCLHRPPACFPRTLLVAFFTRVRRRPPQNPLTLVNKPRKKKTNTASALLSSPSKVSLPRSPRRGQDRLFVPPANQPIKQPSKFGLFLWLAGSSAVFALLQLFNIVRLHGSRRLRHVGGGGGGGGLGGGSVNWNRLRWWCGGGVRIHAVAGLRRAVLLACYPCLSLLCARSVLKKRQKEGRMYTHTHSTQK